ncbi:TPA: type II secretion system protein GspE, partial [Candidatus Saccharibacteria bacterium]|nr:type II secretion system protein GspE [Candidatus Saccharibacteria bacterium]
PTGLILLTGPTGSGKTTAIYASIGFLLEKNSNSVAIASVEDPVEQNLMWVNQGQLNLAQDFTYIAALRSLMRQDPEVIMIGEIRDADTARTAIQASITGHLVLSTFHANTTAAAFSRMIDLIGVNPIFSTAIRLLIAQRLVRRLDDTSKEAYEPDEATKQWIRTVLKDVPAHVEKPDLENIQLYRPVASEASPFGYSGRMILMEQLVVSENIQKFLRGDTTDVHAEIIEKQAREEGMVTLLENGVLAALRGETTIEEVNRVI